MAGERGWVLCVVRLGSKPIEFEKGKNAIAVPSLDKMPLVINILITAVRNGELDEQLAQTKKPATVLKYLKTASTKPAGSHHAVASRRGPSRGPS